MGAAELRPPDEHDDHDQSVHIPDEHDEGGHEPWLISYADMMTLLFCFFVIMYSFASAKSKDQDQWFKIKKEIALHFGGEYSNPVESVAAQLKKMIESSKLGGEIEVKVVGDTLELIMQSKVIFESGSAEIIEKQRPIIEILLSVLLEKQLSNYSMLVEGHTDDVPISNRFFRSNWDLSAARASTIAMMLQKKNYDPNKLSLRAYGEFKPILPNHDTSGNPIESNRARNRRIAIKLVADKT